MVPHFDSFYTEGKGNSEMTYLCSWQAKGKVRVKCPSQEHNTIVYAGIGQNIKLREIIKKLANIKEANQDAKIHVETGRSTSVHNLLFCAQTL